ncbi:hypothetical protein HYFRA_00004619 [Hymenoscyphus fraxineus]|uniref:F-box domain-containing protein n=1 Tax=Hymenoscyphus fraxineus TaxID=746836 RepID=A0A9N9PUN7_9HELO|nr:hypothetical protein HYFRA_00004619 [Hymenoscyphus fraxineus]
MLADELDDPRGHATNTDDKATARCTDNTDMTGSTTADANKDVWDGIWFHERIAKAEINNSYTVESALADAWSKIWINEKVVDDKGSEGHISFHERHEIPSRRESSPALRTNNSPFPWLPDEILIMIFSGLFPSHSDEDLDNLKACRLVCKRWAKIGLQCLFGSTFIFRRDRMDTERFVYLTLCLQAFSKIDRVIFEYGDIGIANIVSNYTSDYECLWNSATKRRGIQRDVPTADLESQKESDVREYARWFINCENFEQSLSFWKPSAANPVASHFHGIDRIDVTLRSTSFRSTSLIQAWCAGTCKTSFGQSITEFDFLLLGLAQLYRYTLDSNIKLKHLSHDMLPATFFGRPISELKPLVEPLRCLQTLHLTFDATEPPIAQFWKSLGFFLTSAPQLRNIRFGFDPVGQIYEEGIWCARETGPENIDFNKENAPEKWYAPLWKVLGDYTWAHLEHLRLDGMLLCEKGILSLLYRHSTTLRTLELHQIGLWFGSFESLLLEIRNKLSLTGFGISGHCEALHATNESWDFPRIYDPYREIWSPVFASWVQQWEFENFGTDFANSNPVDDSLGEKMRNFIFGDLWPIMGHHTRKSCTDFPGCVLHTEECFKSCWSDTEQLIDQKWDTDFFVDPDWEDPFVNEGTEAGHDSTSYYYDGFDDDDFDVHGYNEGGEHYLDDIVTDEEYFQGKTTSARVRRELEASIVHRIPRFWGGQKGEHGEETMTVPNNSNAATAKREHLAYIRHLMWESHERIHKDMDARGLL